MPPADTWKQISSYLGRLEKVFLAFLAVTLLEALLDFGFTTRGLLRLALLGVGLALAVKLVRKALRKAIWRLRNRLLVAYVFIALVPVLLVASLAVLAMWGMSGQTAVYLVTSEFERRVIALRGAAQSLGRLTGGNKADSVRRIGSFLGERYPGLEVLVRSGGAAYRHPEESSVAEPPPGWGEVSGVVVKDGLFYVWAHVRGEDAEVTILAPLTRTFLAELVPNLGGVSLVSFGDTAPNAKRRNMRTHTAAAGEDAGAARSRVPEAVSRFDFEVLWGAPISVAVWESPGVVDNAIFSVHSRISAVLRVVFSQKVDWDNPWLLYGLFALAILFLIVEIISLVIGVSLSKTITGAVHDLYEGTQRIMEGDFSHRIETKGEDQLGNLSRSFNRMSENLQRLLEVAKESERVQAELEIAREVQSQLYPKVVPDSVTLRLTAQYRPARMVSGDYYDFQSLRDGKIIIAIGDVAGKGISAALLMATVQSSFRAQIRHCVELAAVAGGIGGGQALVSTSSLVSQLNQHLYTFTSPEKFATFCFGVYDEKTSVLTYTNAGHLPPILVRNGQARRLEVDGMVVGAFPFAEYGESRLELESGDLLVCFTDGISEPENEYGEVFGEDRLCDIVCRHAHRKDEEIIAAVMESVQQWTGSGELQDDMTLLLARRQ